jgi:hypothetical protein
MSEIDRNWNDAIGLGRAKQQIIELSRRHCLNMSFVESGGRGAAEASTGLPINFLIALTGDHRGMKWLPPRLSRDRREGVFHST